MHIINQYFKYDSKFLCLFTSTAGFFTFYLLMPFTHFPSPHPHLQILKFSK